MREREFAIFPQWSAFLFLQRRNSPGSNFIHSDFTRLGDCEICRKDHYYVIFDVSVRETYGSFARSFFAKILDRSEVTLSSRE